MLTRVTRLCLLVVGVLLLPSAGCVVHSHRPGYYRAQRPVKVRRTRAYRARPQCRPSHYWDGYACRHKGRGHGARKHDYR